MTQLIEKFTKFYRDFSLERLAELHELYAEGAVFVDPVQKLQGTGAIEAYFRNGLADLTHCEFVFSRQDLNGATGIFEWQMHYQHPRLKSGRRLTLNGCSIVEWDDGKVVFHRDYYDMGEMIYENVFLLGAVVKGIRRKLGAH